MMRARFAVPLVIALALGSTSHAGAQTVPPTASPAQPAPVTPVDPFGEEVTRSAQTTIVRKGGANWDTAFDTLVEAFKTVQAYLEKEGITPSGPGMAIYTGTDDTGFQYEVGYPVAEAPKTPPTGDVTVSQSRDGKMLRFVHRGSYDTMDSTYEAITNYLDEKQLDAKDFYLEEYRTNPATTPDDQLVVDIYVPTVDTQSHPDSQLVPSDKGRMGATPSRERDGDPGAKR
jgi:effector-binding domain-containing protein